VITSVVSASLLFVVAVALLTAATRTNRALRKSSGRARSRLSLLVTVLTLMGVVWLLVGGAMIVSGLKLPFAVTRFLLLSALALALVALGLVLAARLRGVSLRSIPGVYKADDSQGRKPWRLEERSPTAVGRRRWVLAGLWSVMALLAGASLVIDLLRDRPALAVALSAGVLVVAFLGLVATIRQRR
jgi:hypothetical protein